MNRSSYQTWVCLYLWAVLLLVGTLGLAELTGKSGQLRLSQRPDPILIFVSERGAVVLAALVMVATAVVAGSRLTAETRLSVVLLVGVSFAAYRLTRLLFHIPEPCQCLSHVSRILGFGKAATRVFSVAVIAFLVVPSATLLRWQRVARVRA